MNPSRSGTERHRGREAALQLLYQWEVGRFEEGEFDDAVDLFWMVHPAPPARCAFATELVKGTTEYLAVIDPLIEHNSVNWRLTRMAVIDRLIMRLAVYEFLHADTPPVVVIDEALELAKTFSGEQAVAFVNGVLDGIRRELENESGREM